MEIPCKSPAGSRDFGQVEGVCRAVLDGVPRIVIVSDDGSRKGNRFARFFAA